MASGIRVTATYNSFGQLATSTIPAAASAAGIDATTLFSYDAATGDPVSVTDPLGSMMTADAHDALGDPLSLTSYPDTGNPNTSTAPLRSTAAYDASQMPLNITGPDGTVLTPSYQNSVLTGLTVTKAGSTLSSLQLSRDSRGRIYGVQDGAGSLASFQFDRNDNATRVIDGKGSATSFIYGANNEPIGVTWPDGHSAAMTYDAAGRPTTSTDERGITTGYSFDKADNLTDLQFTGSPQANIHVDYDGNDRPVKVTEPTGSRTYQYDPTLGRLISVTTALSGVAAGHNSYTTSYTYFGDGSLKSITTPFGTTQFAYDASGQMRQMSSPFGENTTWSYDHIGRILTQTTTTSAGIPISTVYGYGNTGQAGDSSTAPFSLRSIQESVNGQPFETYTLTRSYLGQLTGQSGVGGGGQTESESFGYDIRGRLISEQESYTADPMHTSSSQGGFSYDLSNNLSPNTGGGWSYNTSNQLTAAAGGISGQAVPSGMNYDASGNLISLNGMTLTYDSPGHLVSVTGAPGGNVTYSYNASGERVSRTVNGQTTYFLYAGGLPIGEMDASGNLQAAYTWGPQGLISDRVNGSSRFYLFDELGSTRSLVDSSGTVLGWAAYTAWGSQYAGQLPTTPFMWQGRWGVHTDSETGLLLCGVRYYPPGTGRFLSRDPSGFSSGPNLYLYSNADPVDIFDSNGMAGSAQNFKNWYMRDPYHLGHYVDRGLAWIDWGGDWVVFAGATSLVPGQTFIPMPPATAGEGPTEEFGRVSGLYDSGKASGWQVLGAGAHWGLDVGGAATGIYSIGEAGVAGAKGAGEALGCLIKGGCFVAGTPVQTEHGTDPIDRLHTSDLVLSQNPRTDKDAPNKEVVSTAQTTRLEMDLDLDLSEGGLTFDEGLIVPAGETATLVDGGEEPAQRLKAGDRILLSGRHVGLIKQVKSEWYTPTSRPVDSRGETLDRVIGTTRRGVDRLLYLYTTDELIKTTPEHPFEVKGKGWVQAGRLHAGDELETDTGGVVTVSRLEVRREQGMVYNLLVEGSHDFFVGKDHVLVHNGGDCVPTFRRGDSIADLMADSPYRPLHNLRADKLNRVIAMMRSPDWDWAMKDDPITIGRGTRIIHGGHHRIVAAKVLGMDIPESAIEWVSPEPWMRPGSWSWPLW